MCAATLWPGGENGRKGRNHMVYKDGRLVNLGSKTSVKVTAGVSGFWVGFFLFVCLFSFFVSILTLVSLASAHASLVFVSPNYDSI